MLSAPGIYRGGLYESQLIQRRVPCFDPIGQSMLHPDASGMKHGTRETHENYLGFLLLDLKDLEALRAVGKIGADRASNFSLHQGHTHW